MKQRVPIDQLMAKDLVTLSPVDTLYDAERLFKKHDIRHIPIVEGEKLIGILSYSDLLKISYADVNDSEDGVDSVVYDMFTIPQVMAKVLVTAKPSNTIKEVTEILSKQSFHSIPVVDGEKLVGIVTTTDLLNYFLEQY